MRFGLVSIVGAIPFPDRVSVDFDALRGPIIAVHGDMGAGKSSLVECMIGCITPGRKLPSRGSLKSISRSREAEYSVRAYAGDHAWDITHKVDAHNGGGTTSVTGADGTTVLDGGKVSVFDAWAKGPLSGLMDTSVLLASIFCSQKNKGFTGMDPADRKTIVLRARGVDHCEAVAKYCRDQATAAKKRFDIADARLKDEKARGCSDVAKEEKDLDAAREAVRQAQIDLKLAEDALVAAAREKNDAEAHNRGVIERAAARSTAADLGKIASGRLADLRARLAQATISPESAVAIRVSARHVADIDAKMAPLREQSAGLKAAYEAADRRAREAGEQVVVAHDHVASVEANIQGAARRAADRARAAKEAEGLPAAQRALAEVNSSIVDVDDEIQRLTETQTKGADGRITGMRNTLEWYGTGHGHTPKGHTGDYGERARKRLVEDDSLAAAMSKAPAEIKDAHTRRRQLQTQRDEATREVMRLEKQKTIAEAPNPDAGMESMLASAQRALTEATESRNRFEAETVTARQALNEVGDAVVALTTDKRAHLDMAARAPQLDTAEATCVALLAQITEAQAEEERAAATLAALPEAGAACSVPDLAEAERGARQLHVALEARIRNVEITEGRLVTARASADRIAELAAECAREGEDLSDWTRLAADLGKDGLQAAIVDAIGPELTTITNDLLHTCFGPRWTVTIETQKPGAGDDDVVEGCEVRVLDTEQGLEKLGELLSGGQEIIINEAISLAIAQIACRYWNMDRPMLIRDEPTKFFPMGMAAPYVAMLRKAAVNMNASKVVIISHNPEVIELADQRVLVSNRQITVEAA